VRSAIVLVVASTAYYFILREFDAGRIRKLLAVVSGGDRYVLATAFVKGGGQAGAQYYDVLMIDIWEPTIDWLSNQGDCVLGSNPEILWSDDRHVSIIAEAYEVPYAGKKALTWQGLHIEVVLQ
jgi:hypothetical protein